MKIKIKGIEYVLGEPISFGGEGEIYTVQLDKEIKCIKLYYPEKRTIFNERKIITLINKFETLQFGNIEKDLAFPEIPVYDVLTNKFCGFVMKYFNNHIRLAEIAYSKTNNSFGNTDYSEENVIQLIDKLFFYLKVLHRVGLIIGDINPENILLDKSNNTPVIVDIDSFQVGSFYSNSRRKDYIDPSVRVDGYGKARYFIYSTDSDIFSLAIIAYELMVGSKPHFFQTEIPTETNFKKEIDLSLFDYFINNVSKPQKEGNNLFKNNLYYSTIERLEYLRNNYFEIYTFLKSIFADGRRYYFYYKEKREVIIKRKNGITSIKEVELLSQTKEDPKELGLFMNQYQIELP